MKIVYQACPPAGEYKGEVVAQPSPLELGAYLIPSGAYEDAPPPSVPGKAIIRAENGWLHVNDHRGSVLYDSNGVEYTFTGEYNGLGPIPDWLSTEPPEQISMPEPSVQYVSRAQGKAALIKAGLWEEVLIAISAIEDPTQKALAEVALHDATEYRRDSPTLAAIAAAVDISDEQMDELFQQAAQIHL